MAITFLQQHETNNNTVVEMEENSDQPLAARATNRLGVRCSPFMDVNSASEFNTILISSIRALFGELTPHSFGLKVAANTQQGDYQFVVECQKESTEAVRASLTMVTAPTFLQSTIYRFDVVRIE